MTVLSLLRAVQTTISRPLRKQWRDRSDCTSQHGGEGVPSPPWHGVLIYLPGTRLRQQGFTEAEIDYIMSGEWEWIMGDVHPRIMDIDILKEIL